MWTSVDKRFGCPPSLRGRLDKTGDERRGKHNEISLQCGVNKIQSLRDCRPKALFCFCNTCLPTERLRNAEHTEVVRTTWECVSERHYLINPRLNVVQSGEGQRPDHPRTAGGSCHKALPEPGAKWRSSARCHLILTHMCHQVYNHLNNHLKFSELSLAWESGR